MILGALIIGYGLSLLASMTETTRVEVQGTLSDRWQSSYDILVRPSDAVSDIEIQSDLLPGDFHAGLPGGISFRQLDAIRKVPGVQVAAPVCLLGAGSLTRTDSRPVPECPPGLYLCRLIKCKDTGREVEEQRYEYYLARTDDKSLTESLSALGVGADGVSRSWGVAYSDPLLIAAIDPEAERLLVGLGTAVTQGRYLGPEDEAHSFSEWGRTGYAIPVLLKARSGTGRRVTMVIERVTLDLDRVLEAAQGDEGALDGLPRAPFHTISLDADVIRDWVNLKVSRGQVQFVPGPLTYSTTTTDPLGCGLQLEPARPAAPGQASVSYRFPVYLDQPDCKVTMDNFQLDLRFNPVGIYDPGRLRLTDDPLIELPMELYVRPKWLLTHEADGTSLDEPVELLPGLNQLGLVLDVPAALTNLEAARLLKGEQAISLIRVRVSGADELSEESWARIHRVAREISARTGLQVDRFVAHAQARVRGGQGG